MRVEIVGGGPAGLYLAILLEEGRSRDGGAGAGAERARRDLRLGRRLQRGDARVAARRRPRDPPRDHRHLRALEPARHPLPRAGAALHGPLVLGDRADAAARDPAAAGPWARGRARVRRRGGGAARGRSRRRRRRGELGRPPARRVRDEGRAGGLEVRLVRHRPRLRRVHVHLQGDRARALQRARVPLRRAAVDLHRRVSTRDVARGQTPGPVRRGHAGLLRAAVRAGSARPRALLQPLDLARLSEGHEPGLARRSGRPRRRCRSHGAFLDRVRHQAGDGGLDRAGELARPARLGRRGRARRLRARARARRRADAGGGERERRVLRADRELRGDGADPVRLQPADAERPDHAREPGDPRPAVHALAGRVVRGDAGRAAARVRAAGAARRTVREPVWARAERVRRRLGGGADLAGDAGHR